MFHELTSEMRLQKKKSTAETLSVLRVIDISVYFQPRKMLLFANVSEYVSGKKLPNTYQQSSKLFLLINKRTRSQLTSYAPWASHKLNSRQASPRAVEKETDLRFENGLHAYTLVQAFTCVPTMTFKQTFGASTALYTYLLGR